MRTRTRPRLVTAGVMVGLAGTVAGLAAAGHAGPFAGLWTPPRLVAATFSPAPLRADRFYPSVASPAPIRRVVVIQDPPARVSPAESPARAAPAPVEDDGGSAPSGAASCQDDWCSSSSASGGGSRGGGDG